MKNDKKAYLYWLHNVPGIGEKKREQLLGFLKCAEGVYHATDKQLLTVLKPEEISGMRAFSKGWRVQEFFQKMTERGIQMVCAEEGEYPERLRNIDRPPSILYFLGRLPENEKPAIAMVGARECSEYGAYVARAFAGHLAEAGIAVISGMARGIDGISQKAALAAGGSTYSVLGCGVDICYPAGNADLYQAMQERGGILSPYPPGMQPQKRLFPYRNKIVAGLSDAVLVVEARQKSGTWITVDMALEQGKDVYAVPGRLTDRLSDGCNLLIRQGAGIVLSPEDLLAEILMLKNRIQKKKVVLKESAEEHAKEEQNKDGIFRWLKYLDLQPKSLDEIFERAREEERDITLPQLMFEMIQLCMTGKAKQISGNYFVLQLS